MREPSGGRTLNKSFSSIYKIQYKMKYFFMLALILVSACFNFTFAQPKQQDAEATLNKVLASIDRIRTLRFKILGKERFGNKFHQTNVLFKINQSPFKVYLKDLDKGSEVLYVDGWNSGKCYINPNGFPYVNLSFSALNDRVRESQHNTIYEAGFHFFAASMRKSIAKIKKTNPRLADFFKLTENVEVNGKKYLEVEMNNPNFGYIEYTLSKPMTPREVAFEQNLHEQMILNINGIGRKTISAGTTIKVPTAYAKKIKFYIDPVLMLPVIQAIYDENGLFGYYVFSDIQVNPVIAPEEFTEKFSDYGF
jgi:outer membrane lipoprotein-sorting protein